MCLIIMNYKIEAIDILLNKSCVLERYFPLIPYKNALLIEFKKKNIFTKDDALNSDDTLNEIFHDDKLIHLFKLFLNMYEINKSKLKEIDKFDLTDEKRKSFLELYLLPGIKATRAELYYLSSLKSLKDIASKTAEEIIDFTNKAIVNFGLSCKAPLYKEACTHIAVAKLISEYLIK